MTLLWLPFTFTSPSKTVHDPKAFAVTSTAFKAGDALPIKYACCPTGGIKNVKAENTTPPLKFLNIPTGTDYLALILFNKDYVNHMHWYVSMPASLKELPENIDVSTSNLTVLATTIYHDAKDGPPHYNGPFPPSGATHHYEFGLYAIASTVTATESRKVLNSRAIGAATGKNFKEYVEFKIAETGNWGIFKGSIIDTAVLPFTFTPP